MDRLYRFTSAKGRINHGIIVERIGNGANVIFDMFAVNDRVTLPTRYAYVSFEPNPYVNRTAAKSEALPLTTGVDWQDPWMATVAKLAMEGKFDQWWAEHAADERPRLLGNTAK